MPSGDNSRMWFPEMFDELTQMWKPEMTWDEINTICLHMGERLRNIRKERGINIKKAKCKCGCGGTMETSSKISIRSLLYALKRNGVITETEVKRLDKNWQSYQRKNKLNAYYEPKQSKHNGKKCLGILEK